MTVTKETIWSEGIKHGHNFDWKHGHGYVLFIKTEKVSIVYNHEISKTIFF